MSKNADGQTFTTVAATHAPLPERVAEQIVRLIASNHLEPGEKLPNEFELCEQLNVGRGTVREAVKILAARHVLEIRRGKGTFVADEPGEISDPFGFTFYRDRLKLAQDLLEIRLQIEPWAASLAAERATDADIARIEGKCALVESDILSGKDHLPSDVEFHVSIAESAHNDVLPKIIPVISYSVDLIGTVETVRSDTIVGHRAIRDAIAAHDAEAAGKAMREHLALNRRMIEDAVKSLKKD